MQNYLFRFLIMGWVSLSIIMTHAPVLANQKQSIETKRIVIADDNDENAAWLGVQISNLTKKHRETLGIDARRGVVVMDVVKDSPAEKAGIQKDDVIIKLGDRTIRRTSDVTDAIEELRVGDQVPVEIIRGKEKLSLKVELSKRPKKWTFSFDIPKLKNIYGFLTASALGFQLQDMNADLSEYFGIKEETGVLITEIDDDSPAAKAGFKAGDVILKIDGEQVNSSDDVEDILKDYEDGETVEFEILRKKKDMKLTLKIDKDAASSTFMMRKYNGPNIEHIEIDKYKDAIRHYKDDLELFKQEMKRWQDEYRHEITDRIRNEIEKEVDKQRMEIQDLKEELKLLRQQMLELEKKIM